MSTSIRKALQEEQRKRYLNALVSRAVFKVLAEQDMSAAAAPAGIPAPMTPPADVSAPTPPPEEETAGQPKEFTVDDMIERLNVIRGGRSFTDPEVYGQLVTFFKKQTEEQKTAIEQFLVEIGKIVINVNDQDQPAEEKSDVSAAPPATPPPTTEAPPTPPAPAAPPAV